MKTNGPVAVIFAAARRRKLPFSYAKGGRNENCQGARLVLFRDGRDRMTTIYCRAGPGRLRGSISKRVNLIRRRRAAGIELEKGDDGGDSIRAVLFSLLMVEMKMGRVDMEAGGRIICLALMLRLWGAGPGRAVFHPNGSETNQRTKEDGP